MLLRFKIKNFLSFYEETVFDMFPNPKRGNFPNHIYSDLKIPLLKQAAVYGANGSGKSNFLDAIKILREIAINKDFLKNFPINRNKFRLAGETNKDPISFIIEFYIENNYFIYTIEFDVDSIVKEELRISGLGEKNDEVIFLREGSRLLGKVIRSQQLKGVATQLMKKNPLATLISLNKDYPILPNKKIALALNWFENYLVVLSLRRINPALISILSKNNSLLEFTNSVFREIGLGIENVEVEEKRISDILSDENENTTHFKEEILKKIEKTPVSHFQNDKIVICFENENGEQIAKRLLFKQIGIDGFTINMEIESQSDGTVRILNLIPAFFDMKNKPCVYFIDEIENSIHPTLMLSLIKYLSNLDTKGQLIFTTHETELLNQQEVMRPDEVWFTEKVNGNTKMYSLNDFKIHNTINIRNGYLEGRYGAIPFMGDLNE